jgi:hypothetical protein
MKPEEMRARIERACSAVGLSEEEYSVLCIVGYGMFVTPARLASFAHRQDSWDVRNQGLATYEAAVERLIRRDLLRVLTQEDCDTERRRLRQWAGPRSADEDWFEGAVVFTAAGFSLFRGVVQQAFGAAHVLHERSGWRIEDTPRRVEFVADTREECARRVDEFLQDPDMYLGRPARIVSVDPPRECGLWLPSHFEEADHGWTAVIRFEWLPKSDA